MNVDHTIFLIKQQVYSMLRIRTRITGYYTMLECRDEATEGMSESMRMR